MTTRRILTRRQVLKGAGGVSLGLPFLPSLLPRGARAAAPRAPRLLMFARSHGGYHDKLYPALAGEAARRMEIHPGHTIAWGEIPRSIQGGKTVVSPILQADSARLTDRILSKTNLLRGFDNPAHHDNHTVASFGSIGTNLDPPSGRVPPNTVPSVDQLAAWSPTYNKPGTFRMRSILIGDFGDQVARYWTNPTTRTGIITGVASVDDPGKIFDRLFGAPASAAPAAGGATPRRPLVDAVLDHYRLIRQSSRRLSADDRRRLDGHMEMLAELQRRVTASSAVLAGASCQPPARPSYSPPIDASNSPNRLPVPEYLRLWQTYVDLIVAGFMCGATSIAAASPDFMGYDNFLTKRDWHRLCHSALNGLTSAEAMMVASSHQIFFERVVLEAVRKLDVEEADGRTYLDNSLVLFTNDQGAMTHTSIDLFTVTFGSAGGHFKTGLMVDYRSLTRTIGRGTLGFNMFHPGLLVQQLWANVIDALRIPRAEWAAYAGSGGGYGTQVFFPTGGTVPRPSHYVPEVTARTGDRLPIVVA